MLALFAILASALAAPAPQFGIPSTSYSSGIIRPSPLLAPGLAGLGSPYLGSPYTGLGLGLNYPSYGGLGALSGSYGGYPYGGILQSNGYGGLYNPTSAYY